jgi:predicted aspartyl protease
MPVILGADVFAASVVDIDYPQRRLALHDERGYTYAGPGRALALFRVSERRFQIEGQVEGRPAARFELDTGASDTVMVFKAYTDEHRLLDARTPVSTRQIAGVGGAAVGRVATLRTFTIAGHELRAVPVTFAPDRDGALATRRSAGLIGAGVLGRFRAIFHVARDTLYLEAGADLHRPFERDRTGLHVEFRRSALQVVHVAAGSPAQRAGWRIGESVTAFNGQPADSSYWVKWKAAISAAPGTTIALRDGRGRERPLVLADYY